MAANIYSGFKQINTLLALLFAVASLWGHSTPGSMCGCAFLKLIPAPPDPSKKLIADFSSSFSI